MVASINDAQAGRQEAQAGLANGPAPNAPTDAEIYAMIDPLGDVG
ncbi:hypothetical protein [Saccharopolyspora soli]|nr:hypothetical protein [Saccharopolyspora soli]